MSEQNQKAIEIVKRGARVYEIMRSTEQRPTANEQLLFEACSVLKRILAALEKPAPHVIYQASNKVSTIFFANREDAEKYAGNCGAAAGIQIIETFVKP